MSADVIVEEFPFVEGLPKREKSKLAKIVDRFNELRAVVDQKGMLVPQNFAAKIVGVSKQRIDELCKQGRLERVYIDTHAFITESSLIEWGQSERKSGRPLKLPESKREIWKMARDSVKGK